MTGKSGLPHFLARRTKGTGVQRVWGQRRGSAAPGRRAAARWARLRPLARGEAALCRLERALCLRRGLQKQQLKGCLQAGSGGVLGPKELLCGLGCLGAGRVGRRGAGQSHSLD